MNFWCLLFGHKVSRTYRFIFGGKPWRYEDVCERCGKPLSVFYLG